ncbi:hypothetical protein [Fodinibius sp.]|uniref:hypothetical protein n=1 Tax=Fodinibius sp. TaxID=1872440 RepID=UPI002ACE41C9|nr:hypothetical protein [Fodinibius sp.]MDZ7658726.1 hypothetical protein [Fodinibius sp.]
MSVFKNYSKLFLLGCFSILIVSCDLSKNEEFEETYTYSFQKDKQLVADTTIRQITKDSTQTLLNVSSRPGNNLVFHYEKRVTPPPNVMDGGSITTVYFQIPPESSTFSLEGAELTNANVYFQRSCFCPIIGALKVGNGVLEGQKLSDNIWSITASLQPKGPNTTYTVEWNKIFILNSN